MLSKIKLRDEFAHFRDVLNVLKEKNMEALLAIISGLDPIKQKFLKDVANNQRLPGKSDKKCKVRKIVKVKQK